MNDALGRIDPLTMTNSDRRKIVRERIHAQIEANCYSPICECKLKYEPLSDKPDQLQFGDQVEFQEDLLSLEESSKLTDEARKIRNQKQNL